MPNYYEILEISKEASPTEVKKAFRSLSMIHHPDKGGDTLKFQQLNEAYETLSDPERRQHYDNELSGNPFIRMQSMDGQPGMHPFEDLGGLFNMMFMNGMPMQGGPGGPGIHIFHGPPGMPFQMFQNMNRPPPIMKNVTITLEVAFTGTSIPLEIERWSHKDGMRFNEIETIYVDIPAGIDDKEMIVIKDKGNAVNEQLKGDIKVIVNVENNNSTLKRQGMDLVYQKKISLKEALCGFTFDIMHLNGKQLCMNNNVNKTIIKPGFNKVITGLGMKRGDAFGNLIIQFDVEFPNTLTKEQLETLEKTL